MKTEFATLEEAAEWFVAKRYRAKVSDDLWAAQYFPGTSKNQLRCSLEPVIDSGLAASERYAFIVGQGSIWLIARFFFGGGNECWTYPTLTEAVLAMDRLMSMPDNEYEKYKIPGQPPPSA